MHVAVQMHRFIITFIVVGGALAACGSDSDPSDPGTEPDPTGISCSIGSPCPAGFFCEPYPHAFDCDDEELGECRKAPDACDAVLDEVCACDGNIYDNLCEAGRAGASVVPDRNECAAPAGKAECGARFCDLETQLCQEELDAGIACVDLPSGCSECSCLSFDAVCYCTERPDGLIEVLCE